MLRTHALLALCAAAAVGACRESTIGQSRAEQLGTRLGVWIPDSTAVLANEGVSGLRTATQTVVADTASWRSVWQNIYATQQPVPPLPAVDFTSHSVIVYGLGARYASLQLDSIADYQLGSAAYLTEVTPGSSCIVSAVVLTPALAVDVPRKLTLQLWSLRSVVRECS